MKSSLEKSIDILSICFELGENPIRKPDTNIPRSIRRHEDCIEYLNLLNAVAETVRVNDKPISVDYSMIQRLQENLARLKGIENPSK